MKCLILIVFDRKFDDLFRYTNIDDFGPSIHRSLKNRNENNQFKYVYMFKKKKIEIQSSDFITNICIFLCFNPYR